MWLFRFCLLTCLLGFAGVGTLLVGSAGAFKPGSKGAHFAGKTKHQISRVIEKTRSGFEHVFPRPTPNLQAGKSSRAGGTASQQKRQLHEGSTHRISGPNGKKAMGTVGKTYWNHDLSGGGDPIEEVEIVFSAPGRKSKKSQDRPGVYRVYTREALEMARLSRKQRKRKLRNQDRNIKRMFKDALDLDISFVRPKYMDGHGSADLAAVYDQYKSGKLNDRFLQGVIDNQVREIPTKERRMSATRQIVSDFEQGSPDAYNETKSNRPVFTKHYSATIPVVGVHEYTHTASAPFAKSLLQASRRGLYGLTPVSNNALLEGLTEYFTGEVMKHSKGSWSFPKHHGYNNEHMVGQAIAGMIGKDKLKSIFFSPKRNRNLLQQLAREVDRKRPGTFSALIEAMSAGDYPRAQKVLAVGHR